MIVFFDGTFMRRANGAHARVEALIRFLSLHCGHVTLYSYRHHPTCPWTDTDVEAFRGDFPSVSLVLDDRPKTLVVMAWVKMLFAALIPSAAPMLVRLALPGAAPRFAALMRERPHATLVVNYVDGLAQINGLDPSGAIVETHDVRFLNHRFQQKRTSNCLRSLAKLRGETALLDVARAIIAISPTEADLFRMLLDRAHVLYVPSFPTGRSTGSDRVDRPPVYDLVFVGSDNVLNVDGLTSFIAAFGPWLESRRLAVCGSVCGSARVVDAAAGRPGISLLGFVDDLDAIYAQSKAAVSPVVGTGLKIKILDALARGKPVFASASSLAGLPQGYKDCVFPIETETMDRLLDDAAMLAEVGRRSRAYHESFDRLGDHAALLAILLRG